MTWQRKNLKTWRGYGQAHGALELQKSKSAFSSGFMMWFQNHLYKKEGCLDSRLLFQRVWPCWDLHFCHERFEWRWDRALLLQPPRHCRSAVVSLCWSLLPSSPGPVLLWNKLPCWRWDIWLPSRKLLTSGLKLESFFLSECPIACFHGRFLVCCFFFFQITC